jgi:hypothetical protein
LAHDEIMSAVANAAASGAYRHAKNQRPRIVLEAISG